MFTAGSVDSLLHSNDLFSNTGRSLLVICYIILNKILLSLGSMDKPLGKVEVHFEVFELKI